MRTACVMSEQHTGAACASCPTLLVCCVCQQVRDTDVFKGLDNMVKNFLVSMPLVADLRSPAMRPRHWQQLMDTTKVRAHASKSHCHGACQIEPLDS